MVGVTSAPPAITVGASSKAAPFAAAKAPPSPKASAPSPKVSDPSPNSKAYAKSPPQKKHRLPEGYTEVTQGLLESKKVAQKSLKAVLRKNKAEVEKKKRLMVKATALDMESLVKIVSMKVEVPDIQCPHCDCSIEVGKALSNAYHQVSDGQRDINLNIPGKPLQSESKDTSS